MTTGRMVNSRGSRLGARVLALLASIAVLATALVLPGTAAQAAEKPELNTPSSGQTVDHPIFRWSSISGASSYTLTIKLEEDNSLVEEITGITGTAYTPTRTFPADSYLWRVTPQGAGEASDWRVFTRAWLNPDGSRLKPVLTAPINGATVYGNNAVFSWQPVRGAAYYEVQFSQDPGFSVSPPPVLTSVDPSIALAGATVTIKGTYFTGATEVTFGGTPGNALQVVDDKTIKVVVPPHAPGTVDVAVTAPGGTGTLVGGFTYQAPFAAPVAESPGAVAAADEATDTTKPLICTTIRPTITVLTADVVEGAPAEACNVKDLWGLGTLYWRVRAVDVPTVEPPTVGGQTYEPVIYSPWSDQGVGSVPPDPSTFSFVAAPAEPGGTSIASPAAISFPDPNASPAPKFIDTPLLQWGRVATAQSYVVVIARDIDFTSLVSRVVTTNTRYLPSGILTMSTAGKSYYWYALPCVNLNGTGCAPDRAAIGQPGQFGAFKVETRPAEPGIQPLSPTRDEVIKVSDAGKIVFTWQDELDVELNPVAPAIPLSANLPGRGTKWYEFQLSTSSSFDGATTVKTDSTSYAVGAPLEKAIWYWRVRPVDPEPGTQELRWGTTGTFEVKNLYSPSAPTKVKAKAGGSKVTISWQPPESNGGYPITGYKVVYRTQVGGTWLEWITVNRSASSRSFEVKGLKKGDVVEAYVRAYNEQAEGLNSPTVSATVGGVPSKPRNLNAYAHKSKVELYWNPPKDKAGGITGYRIQYSKTGRGNWKKIAKNTRNSKRTYVWKKGNVGSRYTFRVAARNSVGWGPFTPGLRLEVLRLLPPRIW